MLQTILPVIIPVLVVSSSILQLTDDNYPGAIKEALSVAGLSLFSLRNDLPVSGASLPWVIVASLSFTILAVFTGLTYTSPLKDDQQPGPGETRLYSEPVLFRCRTHHTRLFPQRHSFAYSVLQCGMPLRFKGSIGRLFSFSNGYNRNKKWSLFGVDSRDYLRRGNETMEEKMKAFLAENDMNLNDYPTVYLVTAPRFLGYQFNPVSFWYLKDKAEVLSLVILEVNNTFDERHMYLCRPSNSSLTGSNFLFGQTFSQNFFKEFHVSPFNDRTGKYNVLTRDPLSEKEDSNRVVNTTITLYDDFGNKKLIAGLRSMAPPIFLSELSTSVISSTIFVMKYGWSGLITFPRIVWEAAKLFGIKRLKIYLRPEVKRKTISRNATALEIELEKYFRLYLRTRVEKHTVPTIIHYNSAGIGNLPHEEIFKPTDAAVTVPKITFTVLSPRFYIVWAASWSIQEVLSAEELRPEHKKIFEVSDVVRVTNLLDHTPLVPWSKKYHGRALTWPLIKIMRGQKPPALDRLLTKDLYILNTPKVDPIGYSRCVFQAVLTMRVCYGDEMWLGAYDLAIRGILVYFTWSGFMETGGFALKPWAAIGGLTVWRTFKDFM